MYCDVPSSRPRPPVGLTMAQNIGVLVSQWAFMEALKLGTLYIAQYAGLV